MLIRHLRLPNGKLMLYPSGKVVDCPPTVTEISWEEFSGYGNPPGCPTQQPYYRCTGGGQIIMDQHLENLAKAYENRERTDG